MTFKTLATAAVALAVMAGVPARADWQRLGTVVFDDPYLRQVVQIPPGMGPMTDIRFAVTGNDVEIASVTITYGNGQSDDVPVRAVFQAGSTSRVIPLPGVRGRSVRNVTVVYRAHGKARFDVFGNSSGMGGGTAGWTQLGCQPVGFMVDHDAIAVGGQQGGFKAIRLRVAKAPVEIFDVVVTFGNGQRQKLAVRSAIPAGGSTRALDLVGQVRGIKRLDLLYRSIPTFKGQALVCADGLAVP